ncbi:MAG TPA: carboxypeptidase regulatory-like domain-containing protein [Gemmatimonadaceae bacterium]|nr:carboxypeptidase regulatory-like domain-containing protein [Gemmatimonadaceae bacterium]
MRRFWAMLLGACAIAGCDAAGQRASDSPREAQPAVSSSSQDDSAYRVVSVTDGGQISGRVTVHGHVRRDSVMAAVADTGWCRSSRRVTLVEGSGDRVAGAVVWLEGVRAGKPLPALRRYALTTRHCAARPLTQAAIAGGMLNVQSLDPITHKTRFLAGAATIDVVDQSDAGQVVPTAAVLAHPGLVTVRCDVHPVTRAWIRVFDHPYFTVTARDGSFRIDSVPPGDYRLSVWQPSLGERDTTIHVAAKRAVSANVVFTPSP